MSPRTSNSLKIYRETCERIMTRSDNRCEVFLDEDGEVISDKPKIKRCAKYIVPEQATWTNFAHRESRYAKSVEWVNDEKNIIFSCEIHHRDEERKGGRLEFQEYSKDELIYIADE